MKITETIDPLNKFNHMSLNEIKETLGMLPFWVVNPNHFDLSLKEALTLQYGFGGLYQSTGQTITKDGVYQYPEDPDLYPLIKIERGESTFYQYQYGLIAIVQKDGSSFCTRMD